MRRTLLIMAMVILCSLQVHSAPRGSTYWVGMAREDVTPDYPVRLAGYAARSTECTNVLQHIFAKALAFGSDRQHPKILITVDNCGVPVNVRNEVVVELRRLRKIDPEQVTICSTHTHSAPLLQGYLTNLFLGPLPPDQDERVGRYTSELTGKLVRVALTALDRREPAKLSFAVGRAGFAANRRTKGGPVDHDLPVLFVRTLEGRLRAVLANYACHCTTLTGEFNSICGDWAGFAQEKIERAYPGALCLISIGCGGDANPFPRPGLELAEQHGRDIAAGVAAVLEKASPISGGLRCRSKEIRLAFDTLPTRAEWEARTKASPYEAQHARMNLARLDRGEELPRHLPYLVQTWTFGKTLTMIFLAGEVTVDYSLRLKRELDPSRLWVTAYANDVPCYIPSERVLKEGGYEGGFAMVYYDRPTRFAPGVEETIISAAHDLVPRGFRARAERGAAGFSNF